MLFEAGIILGAHSEAVSYPVATGSSHIHWPYLQLERTVSDSILCFTEVLLAALLYVNVLFIVIFCLMITCHIAKEFYFQFFLCFADRVKCTFIIFCDSYCEESQLPFSRTLFRRTVSLKLH